MLMESLQLLLHSLIKEAEESRSDEEGGGGGRREGGIGANSLEGMVGMVLSSLFAGFCWSHDASFCMAELELGEKKGDSSVIQTI